jgi:hypothetical protein
MPDIRPGAGIYPYEWLGLHRFLQAKYQKEQEESYMYSVR